jgi:hypothetical protein
VPVLVKAATPRAYIKWLTREKKFDAVLARVPPETAALMREPPLPSTWVVSAHVEPIVVALDAVGGRIAVRRMAHDVLHEDLLPPLHSATSALLRLFGTSPATLYARIDDLARTTIKGMQFKYRVLDNRAGVMRISYDVTYEIADCVFDALIATLESITQMCGVKGVIGDPKRVAPNSAEYLIRW